jgi:formate/nitrite transporter FocA (FNT family)
MARPGGRGRDEPATHLDAQQRKKAAEEEKTAAAVTHEAIRREGVRELERKPASLAWSAFAAGLAMGLAMLAQGVLHHALPDATWRPLVAAFGYSIGFLVVILGSQQLYTTNTLTPIVPLLSERSGEMLRKVLILWSVVLIANLFGALIFAVVAAHTNVFSPELRQTFQTLAMKALSHDALSVFASGIAAGWVVALMVWMLPAAESSKAIVIILMSWLVGAAELSHVIVGAIEAFYLMTLGEITIARGLGGYILPALLGNTIGGVALVALINHAQVETQ